MRQTIVIALIAAAFAAATKAEVRCPVGVTCIDAGAGVTSPITTDPVSATGVWTFDNAAQTPATFSDGVTISGPASFTGSSRGFSSGTLRLEDDGADNYVVLTTATDVTATRIWNLNFGDAARTLTLSANASLNQDVLTTSQPTFAGLIVSATAFASLGTPANGTLLYCNNCTIANPCASGGTGALAKRLNGVWVCN